MVQIKGSLQNARILWLIAFVILMDPADFARVLASYSQN
jgi:hypothetical protein